MSGHRKHQRLGEFFSTAICGNDILSSTLYVSGIAALFAGVYAPLALLLVTGVLLLYRAVYREVVEALPVNGGTYNALLNSTSKASSAVAGIMTILSYMATAVISAKTGVEYLFKFFEVLFPKLGWNISPETFTTLVIPSVIGILFIFALIVIAGVSESAKVAAGIFVFHLVTLLSFLLFGLFLMSRLGWVAWDLNLAATKQLIQHQGGFLQTLFLAFSASLLGVSGFESSANFIEEQRRGVFAKTLRNMTLGVFVFNPTIAFVLLALIPMGTIIASKDFLLAEAASQMGGIFFLGWIAINAFLVLCGAVLTSFVGVKGLVYRMTIDGCLPSMLVSKSSNRQSKIILGFFALCTSVLLLTQGNLLSLAGVYTISFLSVMTLFALANLILRRNRPDLERPYRASLTVVLLAAFATGVGILGNIAIDQKNVTYFLTYFIPASAVTLLVIYKKDVLKYLARLFAFVQPIQRLFDRMVQKITRERVYVFVHTNNRLAAILDYIHRNENAHHVTLIHCEHNKPECVEELNLLVAAVKASGFFPELVIETTCIAEEFGPKTVLQFAKKNRVALNKIFMGSIHTEQPFIYEQFGGARIIW